MTDVSTRSRAVLARLAVHILDDLGCAAVTPSRSAWERFELPHPYRFGWMPPTSFGDDLMLVVSFCPELIAATTLWLDDKQLDVYLTAIEAFVDALVAHPQETPTVVFNAVWDTLADTSRSVVDLITAVELRALDEGVVAHQNQPE